MWLSNFYLCVCDQFRLSHVAEEKYSPQDKSFCLWIVTNGLYCVVNWLSRIALLSFVFPHSHANMS